MRRRPRPGHDRNPGQWATLTNSAALAVLLAVTLLVLPAVGAAPAASACSCPAAPDFSAPRPPGEVLFEGRVLGGQDVADYETLWTVHAARVFRGDVTTVQPVVAHPVEASCGRQFTVGESYLISATPDSRPGVLGTGLCTDTQQSAEMTPDERRTLEQVFGPGQPPRAAPPAPVPELPGDPDPLTVLAVTAAVVAVLAAALGTVLLARRRRSTPGLDDAR